MGKNKPLKSFFARLALDAARIVLLLLWPITRPRCVRPDGSPARLRIKGGALVVCNHTGFTDPIMLTQCLWRRRVHYLTAKEVLKGKLVRFLLTHAGCVEIDRDCADIHAIRSCITLLKQGGILLMFPEGGIHRDEELATLKAGAILLAMRAGVPILPVAAMPKNRFPRRRSVVVGAPIKLSSLCGKFPSPQDLDTAARTLREKMDDLIVEYERNAKHNGR